MKEVTLNDDTKVQVRPFCLDAFCAAMKAARENNLTLPAEDTTETEYMRALMSCIYSSGDVVRAIVSHSGYEGDTGMLSLPEAVTVLKAQLSQVDMTAAVSDLKNALAPVLQMVGGETDAETQSDRK